MHLTTDPLKTTEATVDSWKISFSSGLSGRLRPISLAQSIIPKIDSIGRAPAADFRAASGPVVVRNRFQRGGQTNRNESAPKRMLSAPWGKYWKFGER